MKTVIVSVINDLSTDQRVHKVCTTLEGMGLTVLLVGRKLKDSLPIERSYKTHRMKLLFTKGALFYAEYNIRLFLFLLFKKADVYHSNDLDTLWPNYWMSKLKGKPIVYDSHEYFTGVPEIQHRPFVKGVWERIERSIFPKLKYVFTVNKSIADLYEKQYNVKLRVMRNIAPKKDLPEKKTKKELGFPEDKKIILSQGAGINVDRGMEEAVEAMQYFDDAIFYLIGNGDVVPALKQKVIDLGLEERVVFIPRLPYEDLIQYTQHADVGITLDKDTNINYKLSLPNKLFDYIHAGIPVLASKVIEVRRIVEDYNVGMLIDNHDPKHIAEQLKAILNDEVKQKQWRENAKKASEKLTWQQEEKVLQEVYEQII